MSPGRGRFGLRVVRRWLPWVSVGVLLVAGMVVLGLWATAPGWLGVPHEAAGAALRWTRRRLPPPGVVLGIAVLVMPFVLRRLERRSVVGERRRARDRSVMLRRVRNRWIKGVLEQSLGPDVVISLGLTRRPDAVEQPDTSIRRSRRDAEPLPAGTSLCTIFDELGGGLLVLGAPGAGKTTALLELARSLLDDAAGDEGLPVPVVFNLSSWGRQRLLLAEWLVDELRTSYDVPRSMAKAWVADGEVLPLLDGLDEVPRDRRAGCVEAINAFQSEHGPLRLVVACRTEAYTTLAARLRLEGAVELEPPTRSQVYGYLNAAGASLDDVKTVLAEDETVWELLRSPLVLSIVALTYQGRQAEALRAPGKADERLRQLLTDYVERMLDHRPPERWTKVQVVQWLAWLARAMRDRSQSEFHLDRLEPDWLPTKAQRCLAVLIPATGVGLAYGLANGFSAQLAVKVVAAFLPERVPVISGLALGLIAGVGSGLMATLVLAMRSGLSRWLALGSVGMLFGGVSTGLIGRPVLGLLNGLILGLVVGLAKREPVELVHWPWRRLSIVFVSGVVVSLAVSLLLSPGPEREIVRTNAVFNGLLFALVLGLVRELADHRSTPNEGIHRSARHALAFGLIGGWGFGLAVGLVLGQKLGLQLGLVSGLAAGLVTGLFLGLFFGGLACLRHLVVRALLLYKGFAPRPYVRFLDEAVERLFLRRAGSSYIFVHQLLLEHFAELHHAPSPHGGQAAGRPPPITVAPSTRSPAMPPSSSAP